MKKASRSHCMNDVILYIVQAYEALHANFQQLPNHISQDYSITSEKENNHRFQPFSDYHSDLIYVFSCLESEAPSSYTRLCAGSNSNFEKEALIRRSKADLPA